MLPSDQCLHLIYRHQDSTGNYANPTQTLTSTCLFFQLCHFLCLSQFGTCSHFCGLLVACELYKGILRPVMDSAILLSWVTTSKPTRHLLTWSVQRVATLQKFISELKHNIIAMIMMHFIFCHPPSEKFSDFATFLPFPYCLGIDQNNGLHLCSDLWVLIGIWEHHFPVNVCIWWQGEYSFCREENRVWEAHVSSQNSGW